MLPTTMRASSLVPPPPFALPRVPRVAVAAAAKTPRPRAPQRKAPRAAAAAAHMKSAAVDSADLGARVDALTRQVQQLAAALTF